MRLWVAMLLVACSPDPGPARSGDPGGGDPSGGDPLVVGQGVALELADETVTGELVAVYDHSTWWHDASDEITYGVFDHASLLPYPDDASMSFVSSFDIVASAPAALEGESYRDALRTRGVLFETLPLAGVSYVITGNDSYHLDEDGYGNFAWDFEITDSAGSRLGGVGWANEDYLVWDAEVFLPTGGTVIEVVRDVADNQPGSYEDGAVANMVGVHLYGEFYLYLLHFRENTIPAAVQVGSALPAGTYLGRVGNSGVSLEPHLHVTVLWWQAEADRSWSVPSELADVYWSETATGPGQHADFLVPATGTWLAGESW